LVAKQKKEEEALAQERKRNMLRWKAVLAQIQIRAHGIVLEKAAQQERQKELRQRKWQRIFEEIQKKAREIILREEEAIKERLDIFREKTRQVLDFYKEKGILIEVDGEREIEKIYQDILEKLNLSS